MFASVLATLVAPVNLAFMLGGVAIGIVFGAIPGLNGTGAMALMLPLSFALSQESAIIFMASIYMGGVSGGLISAVLMGVPGSASNIATCFDGHPMAKNGQAGKALGIGVFSSLIATVASLAVAFVACRPIASLAIKLGPWELFSLCTAAIVMVITISKGNMFSGLISACFGLFISFIGMAPVDGAERFTLGMSHLKGGISATTIVLGIFAITELSMNYAKGDMTPPSIDVTGLKGLGFSIKSYFSHWKAIVKSYLIGLWIGFLPGMGAGLSNIVAYASVKASSDHPERFGTGEEEGVIASEISNNAAIGGAIVPTIALGIPGDTSCAILISALMIQGIDAGPLLWKNNTTLVYIFFGVLLLAAFATFAFEWWGIRLFPRILRAEPCYLYAAIFMICLTGVYSESNSIWTCGLTVFMVGVGYLMYYTDMSLSPFILGYLLGPSLERYLRQGLTYSDKGFLIFLERPVSAILLGVTLVCLVWPFVRDALKKHKKVDPDMESVMKEAASYQVKDE